ncbi:MAG: tetratricopeptide repeat protein [Planctomycetota bacterium]
MRDNETGRLVITGLICAMLLVCWGCEKSNNALELYLDGVLLTEYDDDVAAVHKLEEAVNEDKRFWYAWSVLGEVYEKMEDYQKSVESYEKAASINPNLRDFMNLGRVHKIMKDLAKAVEAYRRACEIDPSHLQAHLRTAECYVEIEHYDKALDYGRRAEKIDPDVAEVQLLLAEVHQWREDFEAAIGAYKRALELDEGNVEALTFLALAYIRTEHYEPAVELLTLAIKGEPENPKAHKYLGYCHLKLNAVDEAITAYEIALNLDQSDWEISRSLGVAYMLKAIGRGDENLREKAVKQLRASLDIEPNQPNSEAMLKLIEKYSNGE